MAALEWVIAVIGAGLLTATWRLGTVTGRLESALDDLERRVERLEGRDGP